MNTFYASSKYTVITCCKCGVNFGLPGYFDDKRREDGISFYCPNGHSQCYCDSETKRLSRELEAKQRALDTAKRRAEEMQAQRDSMERRFNAKKGVVTKLKKRITEGRCPCCHEEFGDLKAHMKAKHPTYDEASK